jgi:hypothetical protein
MVVQPFGTFALEAVQQPAMSSTMLKHLLSNDVRNDNEVSLSAYRSDCRGLHVSGAFFSQQSSNLGAAAAASLMAVAPVLIAYLFLQKFFIKGMVAGAEK